MNEKGPKTEMWKILRKNHVFDKLEVPRDSQVEPKMAPSWTKMGFGSDLEVSWHEDGDQVRGKSDLRTILGDLSRCQGHLEQKQGLGRLGNIAGTRGPGNEFIVLECGSKRPAPVSLTRGGGLLALRVPAEAPRGLEASRVRVVLVLIG